jgi:hypothetical protein
MPHHHHDDEDHPEDLHPRAEVSRLYDVSKGQYRAECEGTPLDILQISNEKEVGVGNIPMPSLVRV